MDHDYILAGGGLQNGLLALAILHRAPDARIALVEANERLGGNHTWSFHEGDVPPGARTWVDPLVAHRWERYEVAFPGRRRILEHTYESITSERLDQVVRESLAGATNGHLITGVPVERLDAQRVVLQGGEVLHGETVVDARGPEEHGLPSGAGFQKFLGLEVRLREPWPMSHPLLMDGTVEQEDGFRFLYVLPYAPDRVLLEDTYFSDGPTLDPQVARRRIEDYLRAHANGIAEVIREETGVLAMPWRGSLPQTKGDGPLVAGTRGGWFHPATGYAFPAAVRLAEGAARWAPEPPDPKALEHLGARLSAQARFAHRLNRMLFGWVRPRNRWKIFARFYRLPADTVLRFYAMETTRLDRARILVDRPPFAPWLRIPGGVEEGTTP